MKFRKVIGIIVLVLILVSIMAPAATAAIEAISWTRMACYQPLIAPRACVKAQFEFLGMSVQEHRSWITKGNWSGWQIRTTARLKVEPEGWTQDVVGVSAGFSWYYQGQYVTSAVCVITADSVEGKLYTASTCQ